MYEQQFERLVERQDFYFKLEYLTAGLAALSGLALTFPLLSLFLHQTYTKEDLYTISGITALTALSVGGYFFAKWRTRKVKQELQHILDESLEERLR